MIKNYVKVSWRNLLKNKSFSIINIIGLAIGLASFILITLYVSDELSFDRHNKNAKNIYRINSDLHIGDTDLHLSTCSDPMGPLLKSEYTQVENYVRFYASGSTKLIKKDKQFLEETKTIYADSTLFDVFTIPLIAGDAKNALNQPNKVAVSASTAKRYFGSTDVVGRTIETAEKSNALYRISAVYEDMPRTSHFNFDFIFPMANIKYPWGTFLSHNFQTYIVLKPGTEYKSFEKNFTKIIKKHILPQVKQLMNNSSLADVDKGIDKLKYTLMPITDIHLKSDRYPELSVNGDMQYVQIFSLVAIFILLLAAVNFTNLKIAESGARAKEVGIRKVLGIERKGLILQFLTESVLTVGIAFVIAIAIAAFSIHGFNLLSGKMFYTMDLFRPVLLLPLAIFAIFIGIAAGLYPASVLSSFQPVNVLKGKIGGGFRKSKFRSALVLFQFLISIILICGTIIIFKQIEFIHDKKVGFNKEQVLVVNSTHVLGSNADAFVNAVAQISGVESSSFASFLPVTNSDRGNMPFSLDPVLNEESSFSAQIWNIDYNYIPTLGMELLKGRNFSKNYGSDSSGIIINQTTAKLMGESEPIGKKLYMLDTDGSATPFTVVGIVENFNYESLRQHIGPLCMRLGYNKGAAAFRISPSKIKQVLPQIAHQWQTMSQRTPFTYYFLDDAFNAMYKAELQIGQVALTFSVLAIVIACLGLFGLTAFMVEQRIKEISIRKVLGASITSVVTMFSKEFVQLIGIAFILAIPISWWTMDRWLGNFAYRIPIEWWMFASAGIVAVLIALLTISSQAIRAALANPINSLRDE